MLIIGILLVLVGGAMIETPLTSTDMSVAAIIGGFVFGALFIVPGYFFIREGVRDFRKKHAGKNLKSLLEAFHPDKILPEDKDATRQLYKQFRSTYSDFFKNAYSEENEAIQKYVTQLYRSVLGFRKKRLQRMGITCEITSKAMEYSRKNGISQKAFTDGKYDITEVQEEISAKTVYRKNGAAIHTKVDRDLANYTVIHAKKIGSNEIVCPNCGVETTREALLDGCDYCGTKFTVEDLGSRISDFALRSDYELAYSKYKKLRDKIIVICLAIAVLAVVVFFTRLAFVYGPTLMRESGAGVILVILAMLFAVVVSSIVYIPAFIIVYIGIILSAVLLFCGLNIASAKILKMMQRGVQYDRRMTETVQKFDPNFSIANFYSNVQNKLSSIIYADNENQIQAFASGDITGLLGRYGNVINVDVDYMGITDYRADDKYQYAEVDAYLRLLEYKGKKCRTRKENLRLKLRKSADCKTQVVCAPAVMVCEGCGTSIDLLNGKACAYCGRELNLEEYDWVVDRIGIIPKERLTSRIKDSAFFVRDFVPGKKKEFDVEDYLKKQRVQQKKKAMKTRK